MDMQHSFRCLNAFMRVLVLVSLLFSRLYSVQYPNKFAGTLARVSLSDMDKLLADHFASAFISLHC